MSLAKSTMKTIGSVRDYVSNVMTLADRWNLAPSYIWYRGIKRTTLDLVPRRQLVGELPVQTGRGQ